MIVCSTKMILFEVQVFLCGKNIGWWLLNYFQSIYLHSHPGSRPSIHSNIYPGIHPFNNSNYKVEWWSLARLVSRSSIVLRVHAHASFIAVGKLVAAFAAIGVSGCISRSFRSVSQVFGKFWYVIKHSGWKLYKCYQK